jgi:hypothetical protein
MPWLPAAADIAAIYGFFEFITISVFQEMSSVLRRQTSLSEESEKSICTNLAE